MNIPKDGPGSSASGPQTQDDAVVAARTDEVPVSERQAAAFSPERALAAAVAGLHEPVAPAPSTLTLSMPSFSSVQHAAPPVSVDEHVDNPLARLAEIVSQAPAQVAPVVSDAASFAQPPMPPMVEPQAFAPLPPPVMPQVALAAEDKPLAPIAEPSKRQFSLFRRKRQEKGAPTVAELQEAQQKKGFFSRRASRKAAANYEYSKVTARDRRYVRRRRRVWFEELLGWIFVPLILIGLYYAALGVLMLMGTTPETIINGLKAIRGHF